MLHSDQLMDNTPKKEELKDNSNLKKKLTLDLERINKDSQRSANFRTPTSICQTQVTKAKIDSNRQKIEAQQPKKLSSARHQSQERMQIERPIKTTCTPNNLFGSKVTLVIEMPTFRQQKKQPFGVQLSRFTAKLHNFQQRLGEVPHRIAQLRTRTKNFCASWHPIST